MPKPQLGLGCSGRAVAEPSGMISCYLWVLLSPEVSLIWALGTSGDDPWAAESINRGRQILLLPSLCPEPAQALRVPWQTHLCFVEMEQENCQGYLACFTQAGRVFSCFWHKQRL